SEADDFSELKKITALLVKAFNRRKFYSKPTNNNLRTSSSSQSANKKQEFVKTDNKKVEKKDDEKKRDMSKVKCYTCKKEGHFAKDCKKAKVKDYEYYKKKMLFAKKDKDEQVLLAEDQAWMESSSDSDHEINANMVFMAQIDKVLSDSEASSSSADEKISEEKYAKLEAERYEYMIRYSAYFDNDKQHRKQIADQQVLYDKMSVQLVELDKHVRDLKNTVLEKDFKISELEECVRNKDLEIEKCLERLNVCENKLHKMGQTNQTIHMIMPSKDNQYNGRKGTDFENPSYFKKAKDLRPTLYDDKIIIDLKDEVVNLLEKEKADLETIESLKSKGVESSETVSSESENQSENNCHVVEKEYLDTFSSVRRPKNSDVIWKKKGSSNTFNVGLCAVSVSNLNKNVKRYSRKDLYSHLGETSSAFVCNDAMNVSCNSRMNDLLDDNNFFIFDDVNVKISPVSKAPFRKKPRDSMQPLAEPVAKWFLRIVQICLWIIDSGCSKHMTGKRALLTNFVEKFLGTVCFGNNDFAVIAGYGDV
nr:integrase, catalytic region, zinc finger, CCHC-type, peptidase aspartic, catalytic [Tanacetum cinerariifolium]